MKVILFILLMFPIVLTAQIKEINEVVVTLLTFNKDNLEQLDSMVSHYCDHSQAEFVLVIDNIESDMLAVRAIVNILYTTSSGRNQMIINHYKPYLEAKYNEFVSYCSRFRDLLYEIECGQSVNRLFGRLDFLYFDINYLIKNHTRFGVNLQ